ncbi:MAG: radical SAM protein [Chitinivibrionales bacterium]|nr:radical SAM protein [Chitinivibrionales bacterium]
MPTLSEYETWLTTEKGDPRGYIQPEKLDELWFHTGTNCNLRCPFCLEGSKPGDNRIEEISYAEAVRFIDEARDMEVKKFSFTGGEPFINRDFIRILDYALDYADCLVLTNATEPLMNRFAEILPLRDKQHSLNLRVSLDHPDPHLHDKMRGKGNFAKALRTLSRLHTAGFGVSIARLMSAGENSEEADKYYTPWLDEAGVPSDITIIKFPDFYRPGAMPEVPQITETCMTRFLNARQRSEFMCNFSKMVVKKNGIPGVFACTLVDDDDAYNLAPTLKEAMNVRVMLRHHRCYSCFAYGASCSEK